MGVGGFIVVAACVMTFEARDSAAKVVPARFKPSESVKVTSVRSTPGGSTRIQRYDSKRNTGCQTPGKVGSYKLAALGGPTGLSPINDPAERRALTAAFVQFSRALMENSTFESGRRGARETAMSKSPSAPNLAAEQRPSPSRKKASKTSPRAKPLRGPRPLDTTETLLSPYLLQRQALSMDNPFYDGYGYCTPPSPRLSREHSGRSDSRESLEMELGASAGVSGSQASMVLDLHECQVTLKVTDETLNRRSDVAKRHQLLRQKQIEEASRIACNMRLTCRHTVDDTALRAKAKTGLAGPRHQSMKVISGSGPIEQCPMLPRGQVCCIRDHRSRKQDSSHEKLKRCSEDGKTSPRSPEGSAVLNHSLVRKNAKRRKSAPKTGMDEERKRTRSPRERSLRSRSASTSPHRSHDSRSPSPGRLIAAVEKPLLTAAASAVSTSPEPLETGQQ